MGVPVLIIGRSGSGKSRSMKFFNKNEIGIINVVSKPLPFKNDFDTYPTKDYSKIKAALLKGKPDSYVIDDAGYLLTDEFMDKRNEKGYDKFTTLANNFYELINYITNGLPENRIVYIVMHEDESDITGIVKPKTIGKLLDEKICVEGLFTIVLRCINNDGKHFFRTQSDGNDVAKSPEDMFESVEIDNNLKFVDETIRKFWNIANTPKETVKKEEANQ